MENVLVVALKTEDFTSLFDDIVGFYDDFNKSRLDVYPDIRSVADVIIQLQCKSPHLCSVLNEFGTITRFSACSTSIKYYR